MKVHQEIFGSLPDGRAVHKYIIPSKNGIELHILSYGGIISTLLVPDSNNRPVDVVLGYDNLDQYLAPHPFFGAMVGRYANRIGGAAFNLNGKKYSLAANNNGNHLHGGNTGFDKVLWKGSSFSSDSKRGIILRHSSPDGDEGYPGNLSVSIICSVTDENEVIFQYQAKTDAPTPVNLTNHSYFNFSGGTRDILNHSISINADTLTAVNKQLIPTGELINLTGTPFDFRNQELIGAHIGEVNGGYDHNYCINGDAGTLRHAASVTDRESGIKMEVETTKPGMQFYTGNFLDGTLKGKNNINYHKNWGFCLETQYYPDSPNQASFPNTILYPGEDYQHTTLYRFLTFS